MLTGSEKKDDATNRDIVGDIDNIMRIEAVDNDVKPCQNDHLMGQCPNTNEKLLPKIDVHAGDTFNKVKKSDYERFEACVHSRFKFIT